MSTGLIDESDEDDVDISLLPSIIDHSKAVSAPDDNDVVCGRGKSVTHPGNLKFRQLVQARKEEYKQAKRRDEKTRIAFEIVEALRNGAEGSRYVETIELCCKYGFILLTAASIRILRFLLKDTNTGMWFDVGEVYAREKVSHALRSRPNEERRRNQRPKKSSSRKPEVPAEFEVQVQTLIQAQQALLKSMIETEVFPGAQFHSSNESSTNESKAAS